MTSEPAICHISEMPETPLDSQGGRRLAEDREDRLRAPGVLESGHTPEKVCCLHSPLSPSAWPGGILPGNVR